MEIMETELQKITPPLPIPVPQIKMKEEKIRVLAYCDSPTVSTGFGTVARNILRRLHDTGKFQITVLGINHFGEPYDREQYPYDIFPATLPVQTRSGKLDVYGSELLIEMIQNMPFDILWTLQDPFILNKMSQYIDQIRKQKPFKWISYMPLDAEQPQIEWLEPFVLADYPVAYNDWAKEKWSETARTYQWKKKEEPNKAQQEAIKRIYQLPERLRTIYHGIDTKIFFPLPKSQAQEFRKKFFKDSVDYNTFVVTNVNRNQQRKDFYRTLAGFKKFKEMNPQAKTMLYLHCKINDVGGDLIKIAGQIGLEPGIDMTFPPPEIFAPSQGLPIEMMNLIYNVSDIIISTTTGEGQGLSSFEALAAQGPILMPDNTALMETLADGKGMPIKSGGDLDHYVVFPMDNDVVRPVIHVEDMAKQLDYLYNHPEEREKMAETGYNWIIKKDWDVIGKQWIELFEEANTQLKSEQKVKEDQFKNVGRNDPCPCNSGKKFKKCHGK